MANERTDGLIKMIEYANEHHSISSVFADRFSHDYQNALASVNPNEISTSDFQRLAIEPLLTLNKYGMQHVLDVAKPVADDLLKTVVVDLYKRSSIESNDPSWKDLSHHIETSSKMVDALCLMNSTDCIAACKEVLGFHFERLKDQPRVELSVLKSEKHLSTLINRQKFQIYSELKAFLAIQAFETLNKMGVKRDPVHLEATVYLDLALLEVDNYEALHKHHVDDYETIAYTDIVYTMLTNHDVFTGYNPEEYGSENLTRVFKGASDDAKTALIDFCLHQTWPTQGKRACRFGTDFLGVILSDDYKNRADSRLIADRLIKHFERNDISFYPKKECISEHCFNFAERLGFIETLRGSQPSYSEEVDQCLLYCMLTEHKEAFRNDIITNVIYNSDPDPDDLQVSCIRHGLKMVDIAMTYYKRGDSDPLAQSSNDKQQSLQ